MKNKYIKQAQSHLNEVITDLEIIQDKARIKGKKPTVKKKALEHHINKLKVAFCLLNPERKDQFFL